MRLKQFDVAVAVAVTVNRSKKKLTKQHSTTKGGQTKHTKAKLYHTKNAIKIENVNDEIDRSTI